MEKRWRFPLIKSHIIVSKFRAHLLKNDGTYSPYHHDGWGHARECLIKTGTSVSVFESDSEKDDWIYRPGFDPERCTFIIDEIWK